MNHVPKVLLVDDNPADATFTSQVLAGGRHALQLPGQHAGKSDGVTTGCGLK